MDMPTRGSHALDGCGTSCFLARPISGRPRFLSEMRRFSFAQHRAKSGIVDRQFAFPRGKQLCVYAAVATQGGLSLRLAF